MTTPFMQAVDERAAAALASGALRPTSTRRFVVIEQGLPFVVHYALASPEKENATAPIAGRPGEPGSSPFLEPDPALFIGPVGASHRAILNKFPVAQRHIVLACREFELQQCPLTLDDFRALAVLLSDSGGLGFYNGGPIAGASQQHKHLQWIPSSLGNAGLGYLLNDLVLDTAHPPRATHPLWCFSHVFVPVRCGKGVPVQSSAESLLMAFDQACGHLGLAPDSAGLLPPCNMLVQDDWMLVVLRSQEEVHRVSINALAYGGRLYAKNVQQFEAIRQAGPLAVLREAARGP